MPEGDRPGRRKGENITSPRRIKAQERAEKAVELRKAGATFVQIAAKLGYNNTTTAYKAVRDLLKRNAQNVADSYRPLAIARYEEMLLRNWQAALNGEKEAFDRVMRILTRLDRINGLEQSISIDVNATEHKEMIVRYVQDWANPSPSIPSGAKSHNAEPLTNEIYRGRKALAEDNNGNGDSG